MSREIGASIKGNFFGKINGYYKSTPVIVTPDIPACHSTNYVFTRKINDSTIVVTHTNENGVINIEEHVVKK